MLKPRSHVWLEMAHEGWLGCFALTSCACLVTGLLAFIAQAKYDSIILEIVTFASACVLVVRVVLGYKRMYDR